jgi:hypothetical protein
MTPTSQSELEPGRARSRHKPGNCRTFFLRIVGFIMAPTNIYAQGLDMDNLSPRNIRSKGSGTIYTSPYSSQSFRQKGGLVGGAGGIDVFDSSRAATARGKSAAPAARDNLHSARRVILQQKRIFIGKDREPVIGCRVQLCDEVRNSEFLLHLGFRKTQSLS